MKQKFELLIPPTAIAATIRVTTKPATGAALISSAAMPDPIQFDGPFSVGVIPTRTAEIFVELTNGAQECKIETIGWEDGYVNDSSEGT